jgi:hypothetical protein
MAERVLSFHQSMVFPSERRESATNPHTPHSPNQMNNRNLNQHISGIGTPLGSEAPKSQKGQCLAWISQIDRRWFMGGNPSESETYLNQADEDPEESDLPRLEDSLAV